MTPENFPEELTESHLRTLYQIAQWINSSLEFNQSLNNAIDAVMQVTRAERGFLMVHDESANRLRVLVARGIDGATIEREGFSTTIVNQVVQTRKPILTNNAQFDQEYTGAKSIIMHKLRAILCTPMMVSNRLIGVVYVDTAMKAGMFGPNDMSLVSAVSGLAAQAIENARLYLVALEKGRLERELQMAREIQRGLLPQQLPAMSGYEVAPWWEAAREVAGDFYDVFLGKEGTLSTVMADVSDKGAPAAMFMAVTRTLIRSHVYADESPVQVVTRTNDLLLPDAEQNGMFVTLYYSEFQEGGRSIHVNGGHNPPLIYRRLEQKASFMPIGGRALGWFPNNPVGAIELQLDAGDIMVFYTDGLTEAENPSGVPYGEHRLAEIVEQNADMSGEQVRDAVLHDVAEFCAGNPPFDDMTMLVVKYVG
ncbi:MAG: SpoIIE family protein phosphatase [Anaerolineae bacterium]|nr:SpoIIE family protein phosphatase [Anaerolineae bacterium]MCA9888527.1 SpoIIE family protein phosphatase [Anaerolineae bacterium]